MVLVSQQAPDFTAPAVLGDGQIIENFNLKTFLDKKIGVIFFWPFDFTFVCPTELMEFEKQYENFVSRAVMLVGISTDSAYTHAAWRKTPVENRGIGAVRYPMVGDISGKIVDSYGIRHHQKQVALRASFLIDQHFIVRHQSVNDLPLGRNIDEILRTVDAWQFFQQHGELCPAQWKKGAAGIKV